MVYALAVHADLVETVGPNPRFSSCRRVAETSAASEATGRRPNSAACSPPPRATGWSPATARTAQSSATRAQPCRCALASRAASSPQRLLEPGSVPLLRRQAGLVDRLERLPAALLTGCRQRLPLAAGAAFGLPLAAHPSAREPAAGLVPVRPRPRREERECSRAGAIEQTHCPIKPGSGASPAGCACSVNCEMTGSTSLVLLGFFGPRASR